MTDGIGHTPRRLPEQLRPGVASRPQALRTVRRSGRGVANPAVLQERARIARELHDSVSQTLYAITLTASRALRPGNQHNANQMRQSFEDVLRLAETGQSELRGLLTNVRSELVPAGRLTDGLTSIADHARTGNDLDIRLSLVNEPDVPVATKEALTLISREALRNVVKHSGADRVDLVLKADATSLQLSITDNGSGFDPRIQLPGHFGLQSMRERAAGVGGVLTLISGEGIGTQIHVRVPRASAD
jgi:signal transduction histidine kinase